MLTDGFPGYIFRSQRDFWISYDSSPIEPWCRWTSIVQIFRGSFWGSKWRMIQSLKPPSEKALFLIECGQVYTELIVFSQSCLWQCGTMAYLLLEGWGFTWVCPGVWRTLKCSDKVYVGQYFRGSFASIDRVNKRTQFLRQSSCTDSPLECI